MLSDDASPRQRECLFARSAHACLAKPIDVREGIRVIDDVLLLNGHGRQRICLAPP